MNNKIKSVKNHIQKHRVKYAVAATVTTCAALHFATVNQWNAFLDDHDLRDQYYIDED